MMWVTVLRPLVIIIGVVSLVAAAVMAAFLPQQNLATNAVMIFVFIVIVMEAAIGIGAIVLGVWRPLRHWLAPRPTDR
jgi:hypothetical protein